MAIFQTKLRRVELTLSPFSAEQMQTIGEVMLRAKLERISSATDSTDSPAKPLSAGYAARKKAYNLPQIRDWTYRGVLMRSLKVKSASPDKYVLGPTSDQTDLILTVQRRMWEMWSDSPKDLEAQQAIIRETLRYHPVLRMTRRAA